VGDPSATPLLVLAHHLSREEAGWKMDQALARSLAPELWHGACAVSVKDGKVVGVVLAPKRGPRVVVPLTKALLGS